MSANWMKLSLGCERRARLFFREKEHSGTFKGSKLEVCVSAQKRATDQRAKRRTAHPPPHPSVSAPAARNKRLVPAREKSGKRLRQGMLIMDLCRGGSAGPQSHAGGRCTRPTVQPNSPPHIVHAKRGEVWNSSVELRRRLQSHSLISIHWLCCSAAVLLYVYLHSLTSPEFPLSEQQMLE